MKIQEAIKSGKPFNMQGQKTWYEVVDGHLIEHFPIGKRWNIGFANLSIRQILSTKWELRP